MQKAHSSKTLWPFPNPCLPHLKKPNEERRALRLAVSRLGLLISCLASAWVTYSRTAANTSAVNITHLPVSIFAIFLCVFIVNTLLKIRFDKYGLASRELAVIFAMGLIGAIIPARGLTGVWLGLMAAPYYLATPENGWIDNVQPFLPSYLFPSNDHQQTTFLYEGLPSGVSIPWEVWVGPIFWWVTLILAGFVVCFCYGGYSSQAVG